MSDLLQPGLQNYQAHPDADQLTAFAEHALTAHEQRQTLAHLATCAACRQIVFLAQDAIEAEVTEPEPVKVSKPWFSGWNLVWPAVVVLAGIVAFSVHPRNFSRPPTPADTVTTAQFERQISPMPSAPPAANEQQTENHSPNEDTKKKVGPPSLDGTIAPTAEAKATAPIVRDQTPPATLSQASTLHGAMGGAAAAPVGIASPAPAPLAFSANNRLRLGAIKSGPTAQQVRSNEFAAKEQLAQDKVTTATATFADKAAPPKAQLSAASPAPPPAAPPAAPIGVANETVSVEAASSATGIQLETRSIDGSLFAAGEATLPLLPSHLAASSSARYGAVWLALDPDGALFWTKDQGGHWRRVKAAWDGRATTVRSATSIADPAFELTTEKGVFWTSADGQHWKQK